MVLTIYNDVKQFSPVVFEIFFRLGLDFFLGLIGLLSLISFLSFFLCFPFFPSCFYLLAWLPSFPSLVAWLYNRRFNRHIWGRIRRNLPT
nr:MAG TPA: hypothetical protein [Caudoviricetes sp.]